jgi:hypothetical protein
VGELFENAVDSLRHGMEHYLEGKDSDDYKYAIIHIHHAIELLLKERLYLDHPILIYKNINENITDASNTVGVREAFTRHDNLNIIIPENQQRIVFSLQQRRNVIEHHVYRPEESDFYVVGKGLKFVRYFITEQLELDFEDILPESLVNEIIRVIYSYEERLDEAMSTVNRLTGIHTRDDLCDPREAQCCPECGNETVVIDQEDGGFCYFCRERVSLEACDFYGGFFPDYEMTDLGLCRDCYDYKATKW